MDLEDLLEPEVAAAAAVAAAVASPQVRRIVRRGAIYGLAGLIVAGDAVSSFVSGVGRGVRATTGMSATSASEAGNGKRDRSATAAQAVHQGAGE